MIGREKLNTLIGEGALIPRELSRNQMEINKGVLKETSSIAGEKPHDPYGSSCPDCFQGKYMGEENEESKHTHRGFCNRFRSCKVLSLGKHALGILLILCVTVIWVASSAWIQYIFGDLEYEKPCFMTYFNTAGFAFWNLGYVFRSSWRSLPWDNTGKPEPIFFCTDLFLGNAQKNKRQLPHMAPTPAFVVAGEDIKLTNEVGLMKNTLYGAPTPMPTAVCDDAETLLPQETEKREKIKPYSKLKIFKCASAFCPFWFLANYLFNLSLSRTSVASNTVLSSTSSIWTLLLSALFLGQRITPLKVVAVVVCIGGTVMIAFCDGTSALLDESLSGDALAVTSAFFYAVYTSVLKWFLNDDERFSMGMVFGMVGLVNLLFFWPILPIMHAIGFELFQLPTSQQLWPLVLNTLIGTNLSDVLWARSVVLTSPVVATLGLTLTTPLAMVVDLVWKNRQFAPLYVVGAVLVTLGFVVVNLDGNITLASIGGLCRRMKCSCFHR